MDQCLIPLCLKWKRLTAVEIRRDLVATFGSEAAAFSPVTFYLQSPSFRGQKGNTGDQDSEQRTGNVDVAIMTARAGEPVFQHGILHDSRAGRELPSIDASLVLLGLQFRIFTGCYIACQPIKMRSLESVTESAWMAENQNIARHRSFGRIRFWFVYSSWINLARSLRNGSREEMTHDPLPSIHGNGCVEHQ
jgi:hypothetical protein